MGKKKKALLGTSLIIVILLIIAVGLFVQPPSNVSQASPPNDLPDGETPQDLLVVPEVPLGTITTILACFFALAISQVRQRPKVH